jgi:DNA-binding phage protein
MEILRRSRLSGAFFDAYTGRKKALIPERVEELCSRVGNGERKAALARAFGISRETLYQYLRRNADGRIDAA